MQVRRFVKCRLYLGLFLVFTVLLLAGCEIGNLPSIDLADESEDIVARVESGSLSGIVKDKSTGQKLKNALVKVEESALSDRTSSLGYYTFTRVPAGQVTVTVTLSGYSPQTKTATIRKGKRTTLNFDLEKERPATQSSSTSTPSPTPATTPSSVPLDLLTKYGYGKTSVVRWKNGTVSVYDATKGNGTVDVVSLLNTWNSIIGGVTTFQLSSDPQSPVKIYFDANKVTAYGSGTWGVTSVFWSNYQIVRAEIAILPCGTYYGGMNLCPRPELYLHELGHAVGFGGHTSDGGVMDPTPRNTTITSTVREMLSALYQLPIGYSLAKAPGVPKDGMAVIPLRYRE